MEKRASNYYMVGVAEKNVPVLVNLKIRAKLNRLEFPINQ